MVAKMPIPVTKENRQPRAKLRSPRARRSTMGSAMPRQRQMNSTPLMPAIQAVMTMVLSLNQLQRGPSSRVYCRQPRNSAISNMPR
ncbi:hypothetical protein D3C79_697280 [compost metagenome]